MTYIDELNMKVSIIEELEKCGRHTAYLAVSALGDTQKARDAVRLAKLYDVDIRIVLNAICIPQSDILELGCLTRKTTWFTKVIRFFIDRTREP